MDNRPIGVFDSGLGGLTVVKELKKLLPSEEIVYFGDTGRVPYGTRGAAIIEAYAKQDIRFLKQQSVKMIVAACGTVSSVVSKQTAESFGLPYTGVLLPAAAAACKATKNGRIGVIGTTATIKSGSYGKHIRNIDQALAVYGNACPLFVPLVENGYTHPDNPVTKLVAADYLAPLKAQGVDTLIMGCTHFPLIRDHLQAVMGDAVTLIDPGAQTAAYTATLLAQQGLLCDQAKQGRYHYYVSDSIETFAQIASTFLGEEISDMVHQIDITAYESDF